MHFSQQEFCGFLLGCVIFLFQGARLCGQEEEMDVRMVDTIDTSADIFDEEGPMHLTLTLDIKKYQREKMKGEYMPAHFLYQFNDTLQLEKNVRIKARGKFRRNHCNLAPFWLNIRKADVMNQHLQETKRIKIVTHCNGSKAYEEYLLKEYLAYKIFNIISPVSFRVRLVRMKYVDTGRKNKITEAWAFMIEPEEMVAERHGGVVIKKDALATSLMRQEEMDLVALFEYMIGNADYSVAGRHNMKILGLPGFGTHGYTPVPYDFDYTGLVNAYYAVPGENLGIESVTERYYLGPCRSNEQMMIAIDHINQYRDEIYALVADFLYMDSRYKGEAMAYLESYFDLSSRPEQLIFMLNYTCR
jgi:hypothetical protein